MKKSKIGYNGVRASKVESLAICAIYLIRTVNPMGGLWEILLRKKLSKLQTAPWTVLFCEIRMNHLEGTAIE